MQGSCRAILVRHCHFIGGGSQFPFDFIRTLLFCQQFTFMTWQHHQYLLTRFKLSLTSRLIIPGFLSCLSLRQMRLSQCSHLIQTLSHLYNIRPVHLCSGLCPTSLKAEQEDLSLHAHTAVQKGRSRWRILVLLYKRTEGTGAIDPNQCLSHKQTCEAFASGFGVESFSKPICLGMIGSGS